MIKFLHVYYPTRTVILFFGEAILVASCFLLATEVLLGADASLALIYEDGLIKIGVLTAVTLILSYYFDLYEPQIVSLPLEIYFRILLVIGFSCLLLGAVLIFYPEVVIGPYVYALSFAFLTPVLILWRRAYETIVNYPMFRERVFVLGAGEQARSIVSAIRGRRDIGMEVVDWEDHAELSKAERKAIWAGQLAQIPTRSVKVKHVIIAIEDGRDELPVEELLGLRFQGIMIERAGDLRERLAGKIQLDGLRPSSFLYSEGFHLRPVQQLTRQLVSISAAAVGLLLFAPFFPLVLLGIGLTSKGPFFFRQTRVGVGGREFSVYKFRSMFTDAESAGARWATKNDPRVTKFGMFMRKTRIDEVPQLWNVLRGDMGFVGPRPERPEFIPMLSEALPFYSLRHLIRPGLTGWAQIRYGYGATLEETREKLEYDLYYIKHMSLGLDLLIMFETIKTIIRRRGAQ